MKEFSLPLKLFTVGLRAQDQRQLNAPELTQCTGLRVGDTGLEILPAISTPITALEASVDWPFPQLFRFAGETYLLTRHYIYSVDASWNLTVKAAWFHSGTHWDGLDFGSFVAFTNGTVVVLNDPPTGDFRFAVESEFPLCTTACGFRGQIVVGNTTMGGNWVQWSGIGANVWTPDRTNEAGYRQMAWGGNVLAVRQLGGRVIVYGENGISALTPVNDPTATFGLVEVAGFGLASVRAVGGDEHQHVFVDETGIVYRYKGETLTKLGYQEFIAPLAASTLVIQHNPVEDEFYFSDGQTSYVLSEKGMTEGDECISGGATFDGEFVGVSIPKNSSYRYVVSNPIDMNQRAEKTITHIKTSSDVSGNARVAIDWRWKQTQSFSRTPFFPINLEGVAHLPVAGVEFRIVLRFPIADDIDLTGDVVVGYQVSDKRAIRGTYVPASGDGGAD